MGKITYSAVFEPAEKGCSETGASEKGWAEVQESETLRTLEGAYLFGIRHLSPAGARHIRLFLDRLDPDAVLIESPADTEPLIPELTEEGVEPPVAMLCYTVDPPVHSLSYPFARYSPEYQALLWAKKRGKLSRFIDLPSNIKAPLYRLEEETRAKAILRQQSAEAEDAGAETLPADLRNRIDFHRFRNGLYESIAELGGETDYDSYWERNFEHTRETETYLRGVSLHSAELRRLAEGWEKDADPLAASVNALREAYMKRRVLETIAEGFKPEKIAVILGAYHLSGVARNAAIEDAELSALPSAETRITLMPYSYYRLSSFSGYGAGNYAPFYFEMLYDALETDSLESLPSRYIAEVSRRYRGKQGYASTAQAIEAARLARSLQYLRGGTLPTLKDLHDAATATLAGGRFAALADTFADLDVGTRIGFLPEGVSQTPIQDDMNRQLKYFKIEGYKSPAAQELSLEIRANTQRVTEKAMLKPLELSVFLHRLLFLDIGFALLQKRKDLKINREVWTLRWTPEVEIKLVESVLYGNTVETASAYLLKERLEKAQDVLEVAELVDIACICQLTDSFFDAVRKLQDLSAGTESFTAAARAAVKMNVLAQYGSTRRFDADRIIPVLQQLFLKASLLMYGAASCNDDAAREIVRDIASLHSIPQEQEAANREAWLIQLTRLAGSDDRNPLLSGFGFSLLLELGQVTEDALSAEVSRHLSAGNTPSAGAAWFEGLSLRNHQVLLSRIMLWRQLDGYLAELDESDFKRALVCLRRSFAGFTAREKSGICEILADLWGVDPGNAAEALQDGLSESENAALDALKDFDFEV
ncbi:MAG: DUF5682 family protein [Spirochaetaceae bacterium]|jgi:hypothetical protein|nr:DUF5682 family protein [Spirochaetaceae bacterium]